MPDQLARLPTASTDLVALAGNAVPIRHTEELVACGKQRHVVGVTGDVSESVGHSDRGKQ